MEKEDPIIVTILNRNYPPGHGITGESASELAEYLIGKGVEVNIICIDATYKGGTSGKKDIGETYRIKTFYNGKRKILRLAANIYEGLALTLKARKINSDVTICMTDPPLLNVWVALLFHKKAKWMLWSMDLYPDAFVAGKLVTPKNIFYKYIDKIITKNKPTHIISLGVCQTNYLKSKYSFTTGFTELPCGIFELNGLRNTGRPEWANEKEKIYLGYCGNLGEAHSIKFLYSIINHLNPQKHRLVLSVYGNNADQIKEYAKGREGILLVNSVSRDELQYIDVHLASLVKEWVHISVPSKTVSSVCAGSTFLYHGSSESDNWVLLQEAGWIIEGGDIDDHVSKFFINLDAMSIKQKKKSAYDLSKHLNDMKKNAMERIYLKILELC